MKKSYAEKKAEIRQETIDWQHYYFCDPAPSISWGELIDFQDYFEKQGKRYGLLTEFRENAIC